ncbi:hypothetical protein LYSBPC_15390 [Lysinibacillus piscis]|uniref:Uncharacterized protein n=1 Tax=Lysinibacillus piscis TaxID=2518931 RepID=A0ABQ5NJD3_9BACI|nr:hypothetical protein LYSBPC_15390 [Lysinibacillus sp. KH24]
MKTTTLIYSIGAIALLIAALLDLKYKGLFYQLMQKFKK